MKSLLNDDTAKYLEHVDYTSTWSVAHHMRFLMFANYVVTNNIKSVLDVGFGQNVLVKYLKDAGFTGTYTGLDMNPDYVKDANSWLADDGSALPFTAKYVCGGIGTIELTTFECVVLGEVIEHMSKDIAGWFLGLCKKLLTADGTLLLSTPNKIDGKINWPEDHVDEFAYDELIETCTRAGYRLVNAYGLWNNSTTVQESLSTADKEIYLLHSRIIPKSLLNVMFCIEHPELSRAVLLLLKPVAALVVDENDI